MPCSFFFERGVHFPENKKTVSSPTVDFASQSMVEIHYDSLDLHFKTTALEKKLVAKILSITRR